VTRPLICFGQFCFVVFYGEERTTGAPDEDCRVAMRAVNNKGSFGTYGLINQEDAAAIDQKLMYTEPDLRGGAFFISFHSSATAVWGSLVFEVLQVIKFHNTLTSD